MLKRLRIILVCLLALALPVQGFAAATMLFCAGGHHHGSEVSAGGVGTLNSSQGDITVHQHSPGTPAHEHADGHPHGDVGDLDQHDHLATVQSDAGHDHQHASGDTHAHGKSLSKPDGKCSACAACCTSVALPTTLAAFRAVKADSPLVPVVTTSSVGFLTDGQDRPPRFFLA